MVNKYKTCPVSGLPPQKLPNNICIPILLNKLEEEIRKVIFKGYTIFQTGMAMETDIWAAEIILKLKTEFPYISLFCYQPCETQVNRWIENWREKYYKVLSQADDVICLQKHYSSECMKRRNYKMINCSSCLIAVYDNQSCGGTLNTINYAKKQRLNIVLINPFDCL